VILKYLEAGETMAVYFAFIGFSETRTLSARIVFNIMYSTAAFTLGFANSELLN